MKKLVLLLLLASSSSALADLNYTDNKKTATHDCAKEPDFAITANDVSLKLTGVCGKIMVSGNKAKIAGSAKFLAVSGNKNTLELDAAGELNVTGNDNLVSWKQGLEKGKNPAAKNSGNGNKITQIK
jgi:hypothetical protein